MGRRDREDEPGAWHHVMNRGLARRTVFENRIDMRRFLAELAHCVRAKRLEVHAYALLSTHFHLLVRSPTGELAEAMRRCQNAYVRWFNRSRRRDGPLFRGRYCSRRVDDDAYRWAVVRYIDANPVEAGLAPRPELYPFCSAHHDAKPKGPPWLERGWTEPALRRRPRPLGSAGPVGGSDPVSSWVERRLLSDAGPREEAGSLLPATPDAVLDWMQRKARLGDGTRPGQAFCDPADARQLVDTERTALGPWILRGDGPPVDGWRNAEILLLKLVCGASLQEIALRCGVSKGTAAAALRRHRGQLDADPHYGARMAGLVRQALEADPVRSQVSSCGVSADSAVAPGAALRAAPGAAAESAETPHELT